MSRGGRRGGGRRADLGAGPAGPASRGDGEVLPARGAAARGRADLGDAGPLRREPRRAAAAGPVAARSRRAERRARPARCSRRSTTRRQTPYDLLGVAATPSAARSRCGPHPEVHALMERWGWSVDERDCLDHQVLADALDAPRRGRVRVAARACSTRTPRRWTTWPAAELDHLPTGSRGRRRPLRRARRRAQRARPARHAPPRRAGRRRRRCPRADAD